MANQLHRLPLSSPTQFEILTVILKQARNGVLPRNISEMIINASPLFAASHRPIRSFDRHASFAPRLRITMTKQYLLPPLCDVLPSSQRVTILSSPSWQASFKVVFSISVGYFLGLEALRNGYK